MSLQERLGREIKQKVLVGATTLAVIIAGCASPVESESPVKIEQLPVQTELPVKIEFPPCDVNPESKTVEVANGVTVVIGGLEITKGNNPEELKVQATSQEMSPLSVGQVKSGETAIDLKTGRIFEINGDSIITTCD